MSTYTGKVSVVTEHKQSLIILPDEGHGQMFNPGPRAVSIRLPVRLSKRYILEGSDNLGIPNLDDKEDKRVKSGMVVMPQWVAIQLNIGKSKAKDPEPKVKTKKDIKQADAHACSERYKKTKGKK